jgi:hypothetical protein
MRSRLLQVVPSGMKTKCKFISNQIHVPVELAKDARTTVNTAFLNGLSRFIANQSALSLSKGCQSVHISTRVTPRVGLCELLP